MDVINLGCKYLLSFCFFLCCGIATAESTDSKIKHREAEGVIINGSNKTEPLKNLTAAPLNNERIDSPTDLNNTLNSDLSMATSPVGSQVIQPKKQIMTVFLSLLVIVSIIVGLSLILRRSQFVQQHSANSKMLSVEYSIPVGSKEKIALVQIGNQQVLVGITPHTITTIMTLDEPLPSAQTESGFQNLLKKTLLKPDFSH